MRRLWLFPWLLSSSLAAQSSAPLGRAVETITPSDITRRIGIVAADSMMGRDTPSRGLELTARYVAEQFRQAGLRPAGDGGGYIQRFGLTRWVVDTSESAVQFSSGTARATARLGVDARYVDGKLPDSPVRGDILLLTKASADRRARGRIVLLLVDYSRPLPPTLGPDVFRLAGAGPRAVLIISNRDSATFAARLYSAGLPRLTRDSALDTPRAPVLEVHQRALGSVLAAAGIEPDSLRRTGAGVAREVENLSVELRLQPRVLSRAQVPNVIGVLEGHDSLLKHQYVAYSAHIDAVGITPGQPDSINNGADDNASGVAGLLELMEAFSLPGIHPRRSILFFAPGAEEPGLLGSAHFTEYPTVPLDSIVANINMDLIGRNWRDSVIAVGPEFSDLGEILQRVVRAHPELEMTPIADRWPEERIFYRSDHYNFARRGVPVLFFTSGTHSDYHRPSDEPARIDAEKESRLVRLLFYLGAAVANRDQRPRWNPESYRQIVESS